VSEGGGGAGGAGGGLAGFPQGGPRPGKKPQGTTLAKGGGFGVFSPVGIFFRVSKRKAKRLGSGSRGPKPHFLFFVRGRKKILGPRRGHIHYFRPIEDKKGRSLNRGRGGGNNFLGFLWGWPPPSDVTGGARGGKKKKPSFPKTPGGHPRPQGGGGGRQNPPRGGFLKETPGGPGKGQKTFLPKGFSLFRGRGVEWQFFFVAEKIKRDFERGGPPVCPLAGWVRKKKKGRGPLGFFPTKNNKKKGGGGGGAPGRLFVSGFLPRAKDSNQVGGAESPSAGFWFFREKTIGGEKLGGVGGGGPMLARGGLKIRAGKKGGKSRGKPIFFFFWGPVVGGGKKVLIKKNPWGPQVKKTPFSVSQKEFCPGGAGRGGAERGEKKKKKPWRGGREKILFPTFRGDPGFRTSLRQNRAQGGPVPARNGSIQGKYICTGGGRGDSGAPRWTGTFRKFGGGNTAG